MPFADDNPGYEIENEEQARTVVLNLVKDVESARNACNIIVPDNHRATIELQRQAYARFMVKHGGALGTLTTLHRCRRLNDVAYNELRQRVIQTLAPTIVGGF